MSGYVLAGAVAGLACAVVIVAAMVLTDWPEDMWGRWDD